MKLPLLLLVASASLVLSVEEKLPSLEGAKIYRVTAETGDKLFPVRNLQGREGYDLLKSGYNSGYEILLMVTAEKINEFENFLAQYDIADYAITVENVQEAVEEESARQNRALSARVDGRFSFTAYQRYDTIVEYLREIAETYSGIASIFELGRSYEGRIIYGLKISSGGTGKPAVLIDGAFHAREWITPAASVYLIDQLVKVANNSDLIESVDWYIIPVVNPDGYEFSHTSYRLWRKTRSVTTGSSCRGVDPNRNFGYYWMLNGASSIPCAETYAGTEAFSEPETQALRDFVLENAATIKLYLTLHSYGNYLLYPWGYTSELPDNDAELRALAEAADDALSTLRGTRYTIGTSTNVLYAAAGGSDDWVKGVGGVELAYTLELPGGGLYGFDPPASEILPASQEIFLATRVFGEYIATKFGSAK